jgi:hypothetical protein
MELQTLVVEAVVEILMLEDILQLELVMVVQVL